jgi:F0F1-type ATP synthase assembly protein I
MFNRRWALPGRAKSQPEQGSRLKQETWSVFPFRRLIAAQIVVALAAAALAGFDGAQSSGSALAGAAICGIANVYAAWRTFVAKRGTSSEFGELANLYRAEFGKFVMIGALSVVLFSVSEVEILAFVGGCLGAILAGTLVAATFNPRTAATNNSKIQNTHGE